MTTTVPATIALAQGIPTRTLNDWTTPRGELATRSLESVRDELRQRRRLQDPQERTRTLAQVHVRFGDGTKRAQALFMEPGGVGEPLTLTHHALRALGREVLPGRGLDFLLEEVNLGEQGRKLADMNFATFARSKTSDPKMFRTAVVKDPDTGAIARAIRSLHSTDYAPYDNLEFVEDLLSGGYDSFPLVSFRETDQSIRFRFLDGGAVDLKDLDGEGHGFRDGSHVFLKGADGKQGLPIPSFECWNSEVGSRAVTIKAGMFRLICTNSAGHWEDDATWRWIHRGDRERIRVGVRDCVTEARVKAAGVVKAYENALNVSIDDAYTWFEQATKGRDDLTKGEREEVKGALHDPTTTPGSRLASVVDAVTLIAQKASDEFEQERIEAVGTALLRRGLSEGLQNGGRIAVAA